MKIALAQINPIIGDFQYNLEKIKKYIIEAKKLSVDLIVFGELVITGYPPADFLERADFIKDCENTIQLLCKESTDIGIIIGAPSLNLQVEGKDLFNSAFFLFEGKIQYIQHKALLPTYDVFDEYRYFEAAQDFKLIHYKGKKIALTVCEDIWNVGNENPLYTHCPLDHYLEESPDFIINISASPFHYAHAKERIQTIQSNVKRYQVPLFYVNLVGAQTDLIFDGGSLVMSAQGKHWIEMPYFKECMEVFSLDQIQSLSHTVDQPKEKFELIHQALIVGIRDFFSKLGLKTATLGLSGGIDSALVAVLAQQALGSENLRVLLLPSQYSSDHSLSDAIQLAQNLHIRFDILPIEPIFNSFEKTLAPVFFGKGPDLTEENLQARIRGTLLMALSNKWGNLLLNTSNKSEAAVGYGTLYGDMAGGLSVIGDLYKTEVYALCHYINRQGEIIPANTIMKAPSAELRENQKDSDSLPDYDLLDSILRLYIEENKSKSEICSLGFDADTVDRVILLVNRNEFKRGQMAPVLRISKKSFGQGRRYPIVAKYK